MGNETSKMIYIAKKIKKARKDKQKAEREKFGLKEQALPKRENHQVKDESLNNGVQKKRSEGENEDERNYPIRQARPIKIESPLLNQIKQNIKLQHQALPSSYREKKQVSTVKEEVVRGSQNFMRNEQVEEEKENQQEQKVPIKREPQNDYQKMLKQINWGGYGLSEKERWKKEKREKKREIIEIEDSVQEDMKAEQLSSQSDSSYAQDIEINLLSQIQESQMIDEAESNQLIQNVARRQSVQSRRIKVEYHQRTSQEMGIFQWNDQQDQYSLQLSEEEALLFEFQKQMRQKGKIQSEELLSKIKEKIYLKSVDTLATGFNYDLFTNIQDMQQHEHSINVKINSEIIKNLPSKEQNNFGFGSPRGRIGSWDINRQLMQIQQLTEEIENNRDGVNVNATPEKAGRSRKQKKIYEFIFSIDSMSVGRSSFIQNVNLRYDGYENKQKEYFESLNFLLKNKIIEIEMVKVFPSPYREYDFDQIYNKTRLSSTPDNLKLLKIKQQAQFQASFPLTLNLLNYYQYICEQKLKKQLINPNHFFSQNHQSQMDEERQFTMTKYRQILRQVYNHIKNVVSFTKKSKWNENIRNQLKPMWKNFEPAQGQNDENESQSSNNEFDIDETKPLGQGNNLLSDQEVIKQQLQKLMESGNWFSLSSSKVTPRSPSPYFGKDLKPYQQLALAWMLYRQNCPIDYKLDRPLEHPRWERFHHIDEQLHWNIITHQILNYLPIWKKKVKGGLLCDEMGLGKTVMSLALIDTHIKRQKNHPQRQAGTLIIVPSIVLLQWKAKIKEFLPHISFTVVTRGRDLMKQDVLKSQIILTTFGIVRSQMKTFRKYQFSSSPCTLYNFDWFRIIVDEAHNLRNHKTCSAKGIQQFNTSYMWLMTGTPIQNKLSDLNSYFNILNFKQEKMIKNSLKKGFLKSDKAVILLKETLKDIMIRRKKDTLDEFGKPLLELKQFKWIHNSIEFTAKEQQIYNGLKSKVMKIIDEIIAEDREEEEWDIKMQRLSKKIDRSSLEGIEHVFGKMMKMRQFCCHPELLNSRATFIKYEDFHKHYKLFCQQGYDVKSLRNYPSSKKNEAKQIFRRIFLSSNQVKLEQRKDSVYEDIMSREPLTCTYCEETINLGLVTVCLHLYCEDCFKQLWMEQKTNKEKFKIVGEKERQRRYMLCHDFNCQQRIYHRQTLQLPRINRFNKEISEIMPNRKINQLVKEIKLTLPEEKVVVYTHFIGMIEILMATFQYQSISALRIIGNDDVYDRDKKISAFRERQDIKVLVISTKCGYSGLNLQNANKLFFMQPWWNPSVEEQALGRLVRYGQENQVEATRFIIKDSIEEKINLMGQEKKLLSEFILDSDSSKKRQEKIKILKIFRQQLGQMTNNSRRRN